MSSVLGKIIADFDTSITAKISVGGTTATLLSILDDDGATIANGRYFITIDGGNSLKEHFSCTLTGTALTALKSISRKGVESAGAVREHRVGATVIMTNFAHIKFLNDLLDGTTDLDGETPLKYDADPTLTDDKHIATKKYIDDIAIAGCSKATDANEGISKLSVAAASATDPIVVGDNDGRVPTQDENNALVGTHNTPSTSKPYVNNDLVVSHTPNTVGNLVGGSGATSAFATWEAVTDGSFRITVDGTAYNVDAVDFSGAGDMDAVAAILQVDLRVATSGTETVVWDTDHFVITSVQEDEDSEISVTTTSTGTVGTDLSGLGATAFMDCDAGTATQGTSDHDSVVKLDTDGIIDESFIEKDTDGTLAADSDTVIPSQKAVKAYVDITEDYLKANASVDTTGALNLCASANTNRTISTTSYVKHKEIKILKAGIYRIYFGLYHNSASFSTKGKVYKNGSAIGTERSAGSTTWVYYYQDFTFAEDDLVQLYGKLENVSNNGLMSLFRIQAVLIPIATVITD